MGNGAWAMGHRALPITNYQLPITNYQFSLLPHLSRERLYLELSRLGKIKFSEQPQLEVILTHDTRTQSFSIQFP